MQRMRRRKNKGKRKGYQEEEEKEGQGKEVEGEKVEEEYEVCFFIHHHLLPSFSSILPPIHSSFSSIRFLHLPLPPSPFYLFLPTSPTSVVLSVYHIPRPSYSLLYPSTHLFVSVPSISTSPKTSFLIPFYLHST